MPCERAPRVVPGVPALTPIANGGDHLCAQIAGGPSRALGALPDARGTGHAVRLHPEALVASLESMATLKGRAWLSLAVLAVVVGLLLFGSAGTLRYWQAWVYLLLLVSLSGATTLDLIRRDPALLERRMKGGPTAERRPQQRIIMLGTSLGFIGLLVLPALDFRLHGSTVPLGVVVLGDALCVLGFGLIGRVYRENTFASATIEVIESQRVIATGPYAVVRHPMYASALLYILGTPLALGSCWGLLGLAFMMPFLVWRLLDEERLLARELPGYTDYQARVRYRLVPLVW